MNWQPIETAPRDGTHVLFGWQAFGTEWVVRTGRMVLVGPRVGWAPKLHGWAKPCRGGHITHWMPQPPPPTSEDAA